MAGGSLPETMRAASMHRMGWRLGILYRLLHSRHGGIKLYKMQVASARRLLPQVAISPHYKQKRAHPHGSYDDGMLVLMDDALPASDQNQRNHDSEATKQL